MKLIAMRNATDNAKELGRELTLTYNKTRQANITKEVAEIASGAAALMTSHRSVQLKFEIQPRPSMHRPVLARFLPNCVLM